MVAVPMPDRKGNGPRDGNLTNVLDNLTDVRYNRGMEKGEARMQEQAKAHAALIEAAERLYTEYGFSTQEIYEIIEDALDEK